MIYISSTQPTGDHFELDVTNKQTNNFLSSLKLLAGEEKLKFIVENWDKITEDDLRKIVDAR